MAARPSAATPRVVHQIAWDINPIAELSLPSWCSVASWRRFAARHNWKYQLWKPDEVKTLFHPTPWAWLSKQRLKGLLHIIASYQLLHAHGGIVVSADLIWLLSLIHI